MTLDDLSVNFFHLDRNALLDDWQWLIGLTRLPIMITAAGDAFLQDTETDQIFFLDTVEGEISIVADDIDELKTLLNDKDFVARYFSFYMVAPILKAGSRLATGQLFSFKTPPVLGGERNPRNLEPADIGVHFSLTGQIWSKVKSLPDGTSIDRITVG